MKTISLLFSSLSLWLAANAPGQGTFQRITFEGPPSLAPGTARVVTNYSESGMAFRPVTGYSGFVLSGAPTNPIWPNDGTAFIQVQLAPPTLLALSATNGSLFGLVSVDLSQYSTTLADPVTISFVGFRPDGSTVTNAFTTPGYSGTGPLTFQTYYFGPEFSGVASVQIPTSGWSMDNLGVLVPEPSTGTLLLLGALALGAIKLWRQRRK